MKSKGFLFLVLATLVAGGAFAQKVGDTVQVSGQPYTIQTVNGDVITIRKALSIEGVWNTGGSNGNVKTINGNTGVYTQIVTAVVKDAVSRGYVKVGDPSDINIIKTGDRTWKGQCLVILYKTSSPNVCIGVTWTDSTYTLSADGKTLQISAARNTDYPGCTFSFTRQ
jgi:hypothetical protein